MVDWLQSIDIYCERTDPGFWSEPLNFITNAAFFITSVAAYQKAKTKDCQNQPTIVFLLSLSFMVGIGSGLFHSFANMWTQLADILAIGIYVLAFLVIWNIKVLQLSRASLALSLLGLIGITLACGLLLSSQLGESSAYLGIFVYLIYLGRKEQRLQKQASFLFYAGIIFAISLVFRTIDLSICQIFPLGSHFLWHSLNAIVIYLSLMSLIRQITPD